jgi:hypothetical protein
MENLNYKKERKRFHLVLLDLPLEYRIVNTPNTHRGLAVNASERKLLIKCVKDIQNQKSAK